jgi:hypothetical protein
MIFSNFWGLVRDWLSFWLLHGIGYLWGAYGCCLDLAASKFLGFSQRLAFFLVVAWYWLFIGCLWLLLGSRCQYIYLAANFFLHLGLATFMVCDILWSQVGIFVANVLWCAASAGTVQIQLGFVVNQMQFGLSIAESGNSTMVIPLF